jgi:polyisoprenoid-binding protein YceI
MRKILSGFALGILAMLSSFGQPANVYTTDKGEVKFLSDAPLEMISASSGKLRGALNLADRSFSFAIAVNSFEGFNSALQKTHFNQDYMESHLYPEFTFKGKLIEEADISATGDYRVRAKGRLSIHGIETDRIVRCEVRSDGKQLYVTANFTVFINDHNIKVPSILNQKIAEEIKVDISFIMKPLSR